MFRLGWILVQSLRRPRIGVLDESTVGFRVLPTDIDLNGHMNNGRYLWHMDLARADLTIRTGMMQAFFRRRWTPLVGSAVITFRRSLLPFQRYEMRSRILCWDDKWFYFEHRFERQGAVAWGLVKALFRGRGGNIAPVDVVTELGSTVPSPPLPRAIAEWRDLESASRATEPALSPPKSE